MLGHLRGQVVITIIAMSSSGLWWQTRRGKRQSWGPPFFPRNQRASAVFQATQNRLKWMVKQPHWLIFFAFHHFDSPNGGASKNGADFPLFLQFDISKWQKPCAFSVSSRSCKTWWPSVSLGRTWAQWPRQPCESWWPWWPWPWRSWPWPRRTRGEWHCCSVAAPRAKARISSPAKLGGTQSMVGIGSRVTPKVHNQKVFFFNF